MGRLSEITLGDLTKSAARYRPVAVTVIVIFVILTVLPDRGGRQQPASAQGANNGGPRVGQPGATTTTTAPPADASTTPTASDTSTVTFAPSSSDSFVSSGPSSFSSTSDTAVVEFSGPREEGDTGGDTSDSTSGGETAADTPLAVTVRGWATSTAGTPIEANGVPEHSLPVGRRFGQDDKRSFVRLTGTQTVLTLSENADGARTIPGSAASVKACQITDARWDAVEGESFEQAPKYAADQCVAGQRSPDGNWSFALSQFATRDDDRGFALVPGDDAGIDFQVAFK